LVTVDGSSAGGTASKWAVTSDLHVGYSGNGTLNVLNGGQVTSNFGLIGGGFGSTGLVTVDGSSAGGTASKWAVTSDLHVGYFGNGTLNVLNGGQVTSNFGYIGFNSGSTGLVKVDGSSAGGTASKWAMSSDLDVGVYGNGTLNVLNGGQVTSSIGSIGRNSGSTGLVKVDGSSAGGTASKWAVTNVLEVGLFGNGTLNVLNGGQVTSNFGLIGGGSGSTGLVTVDGSSAGGTASKWAVTNDLYMGYFGNGTLNVLNGGQVTSLTGYIGYLSGSTGLVKVDGSSAGIASTWTMTNELYVGNDGNGTLNVLNGGQVTSSGGFIGTNYTSPTNFATGIVEVNGSSAGGTASKWAVTNNLFVGVFGNGTLNVLNGGLVTSRQGVIGGISGSVGVATIDGSSSMWTVTNGLIVGNNGTGTLIVRNDGQVQAGSVTVGALGTLTLDGGSITTTSFERLSGGTVNHYDGTLTVNGTGNGSFIWGSPNLYVSGNAPAKNPLLVLNNVGTVSFTQAAIGDATNTKGQLTISGGTQLSTTGSSGSAVIGNGSGSTGLATVDGSSAGGMASKWVTNDLFVGSSGNGTLNVQSGGQVTSSNNGYIGQNYSSPTNFGTGTVKVDGSSAGGTASKWAVTYALIVGNGGNGTLNVQNGGQVTSNSGIIGVNSGSTGLVTVDGSSAGGTASKWALTNDLFVGYSGNGTLNVQNGGQVTSSNNGYIGFNSGSTGLVTVDGGATKWTVTNSLTVGNAGTGTLTLTNGGVVQASTVAVGALGTLGGSGTVIGPVTVNAGGTLRGGNSGVGTLNLSNALTLTSGATVSVAINSSASSMSSNFLSITSGASIDPGTKFFIDGTGATFNPASAYQFQIASGAGDQSLLNIGTQSQFSGIGFTTSDYNFSVTGNSTGDVFVNFVPVPEPATVLMIAVAALGLGGVVRRRLRKPTEPTTAA